MSDFDIVDPNTSPTLKARDVLPEGIYKLAIVDAKVKDKASGEGKYIEIQFQEMQTSTKIWQTSPISGSAKAVEYGKMQRASLAVLAGVKRPFTTAAEMIGWTLIAKIVIDDVPANTNPLTGQSYPAKKINKVLLTIPSKPYTLDDLTKIDTTAVKQETRHTPSPSDVDAPF